MSPSLQTTSLQALMHLLKGYIGTGILAMPKAFSDAGFVIGLIGTPIIGLMCNCCIHMLIDMNKHLCHKLGSEPMDYEEIAEKSLSTGPKSLRKFAKLSRFIVVLFLILTQIGFCCAYALFIANNLRTFSMNLKLFNSSSMPIQYYLLIILPFMILINFIKSIKHLSIASTCANVIQLVSLIIIIYNLVIDVPPISSRAAFGNKLPLFFATTVFTYEGITVTMPLYRSMKNRDNFAKPFGVINIAIVVVIALYTVIGFLGFIKYGDEVEASISLSLPNEPLYECVQLMYAIAISISYPVQLYVAIHLLWPHIEKKMQESKMSNVTIQISDYLFRAFLVTITFALAAFIPKLDLIIALIGALSCSSVAIVIPPILHLITFWEQKSNTYSRIWLFSRNLIVMAIGVFGFVTGTYFSVQDIFVSFSE